MIMNIHCKLISRSLANFIMKIDILMVRYFQNTSTASELIPIGECDMNVRTCLKKL